MKNFNFLKISFIILLCNFIVVLGKDFDFNKERPGTKKNFKSNKKQTRPNILFIPIDDLRPDMGCYGNTVVKTPNMDRLAAKGVVFKRAYCQQAVCNPSRASLLTGLRPDSVRVWDLQTDFRKKLPDVVTLPQIFKNNGYYTVGIGKTFHNTFPDNISWNEDLHVDGFPFDPDAVYQLTENKIIQKEKELSLLKNGKARQDAYGFIYTKANSTEIADVDDDAYYDGAQTTTAIKKLKELKEKDKPFFFSVGYYRPHLPFNAPKKYWDLYDRNDIPLAKNQFMPKNAPEYAVHGDSELRAYTDKSDLPLPSEKPYDVDKQRELLHAYYASVSYTDAQIGRLLDALDELGLSENTIVVLWGDHGWKLGEHNSWCKQSNYEIDTRVPLIISGAEVKAKGKTSDALTEFVDIYPTLCDMARIKIPDYLQGTSMKPLLADPGRMWKTAAYSQFLLGRFGVKAKGVQNVERMGYAIRTDRYRYVEWYEWNKEAEKPGSYLARELYDHNNDADENVNIAEEAANKKLTNKLSLQLKKGWRYSKPGS